MSGFLALALGSSVAKKFRAFLDEKEKPSRNQIQCNNFNAK